MASLAACGGLGAGQAAASQADDYTNAVRDTLALVQFAERGDAPSRVQAITALERGTGVTQPEILADLRRDPPDLVDADQRLQALLVALRSQVDTPDPQHAGVELARVLAMPRYAGLRQGPSLLGQIVAWIARHLLGLLARLGVAGFTIPAPIFLVAGVLGLVTLAAWVTRSGLSRRRGDTRVRLAPPTPRRVDFFSDADRHAAQGDYLAALRALAGGVSVALGGERAWDRSPLTVRELFQGSKRPEALRPLLQPFEAAAYGHRLPDAAVYARALEAAAPFRGQAA